MANPSQTSKLGDILKCPACGMPVNRLSAKCPACGHEFTNIDANNTTRELLDALNAIDRRANRDNPKATISQKVQTIRNFPIPNTKEDLVELLSLCQANMSASGEDSAIRKAWQAKAEQLINKSDIMLKDDPDARLIIDKIEAAHARKKKKITMMISAAVVAVAVAFGAVFFVKSSAKKEQTQQIEGYYNIKNRAVQSIEAAEYGEAFGLLDSLNMYITTHELQNQFQEIAGDTYLKLVIALLREDSLEDAATVGLAYREKLNNESDWRNSQIYKLLIQECEAQNVDDSPLR